MSANISVDIKSLNYETKTVLKDLKLDIKSGEFVVLTGLSGSGKSSLLHCMNGLIPELYEAELNAQIKIAGKDLKDFKPGEIACYLGNVFQDPKDQFFSTYAEDEVAIVGENLGMDYYTLHKRVDNAFKNMNACHLRNKSVYEMSGGQKQLIAITSTLVADTDILFLDEPSASLDFCAIQTVRKALTKLKEQGKTILVAEHRLYYLRDLVDRLIVLDKGRIAVELSQSELTQENVERYSLRSLDENNLHADQEALDSPAAIKVHNLSIQLKKSVLSKPLDFTIKQGECLGIIGANGCGKTTLAKQLAGIYPMGGGYIEYAGHEKAVRSKRTLIKKNYLCFQDPSSQIFSHSVEAELVPKQFLSNRDYLMRASDYLKFFDLWNYKNNHPQQLSRGQQQRLALIVAFLQYKDLLILDEPTAGLDYKRMQSVAHAILDYLKRAPIMLISHDLELLFKCCHRVLMLSGGNMYLCDTKGHEDEVRSFLSGSFSLK